MNASTSRGLNAVAIEEMNRRWRAVRARMQAEDIDALVVQNSSDWVGGYVRWFSNQPATNGYPTTVVFPRSGGLTLIEQGPFGGARHASAAEESATGIANRLTTPSYPSVGYTASYDADLVLQELESSGARRVGLVAPAAMYHGFGRALENGLKARECIDFTDAVDRIKAIKRAEERACIRQVAAIQD